MKESQESFFFKGVDQDTSKYKTSPGFAYNSSCFRITTVNGITSQDLVNIKGNLSLIQIPNTPRIQKITFSSVDDLNGNITISSLTSGQIFNDVGTDDFDTTNKTYLDLYNYILNDTGYSHLGIYYNVYYSESQLVVAPIGTYILNDTTGTAGFLINPNYVAAQTNLEVIGNTAINDTIYLLTANSSLQRPTNTIGVIWKLEINDITLTATITLIYSNYLNFSTYNGIPFTAIRGRYENSQIQRIYWTDNYGPYRQLNVVDPQSIALDPTLLFIIPSVLFDIPILKEISNLNGNSIKTAVYQTAYRLKNDNGSVTMFSELSNNVIVVPDNELQQSNNYSLYRNYRGAVQGTNTSKNILWIVNNIDIDYDRIEFAVIKRDNINTSSSIFILPDQPVNGQESIEFTYSGLEDETPISISEFLALSGVFTHGKGLTTKDNRLIAYNVRNELGEISNEEFDSRAYRFNNGGAFKILGNGGGLYNNSDYDNIIEKADAICPYNLDYDDTLNYDHNFQYRDPSETPLGLKLGGSGKFISYEFINTAVMGDYTGDMLSNQTSPYVFSASGDDSIDLGVKSVNDAGQESSQIYNLDLAGGNPINSNMKYPQYNSLYFGHVDNEIYRYSITFVDKAKNPYFSKWIADIRFPETFHEDTLINNIYTDGTTSPSGKRIFASTTSNLDPYYVNQLGLKFNINIPAELTSKIGGYIISRVKRENDDKTIIAEGIISNNFALGGDGKYYIPQADLLMAYNTSGANTTNQVNFVTPNLYDQSLERPKKGDILKIYARYQTVNGTGIPGAWITPLLPIPETGECYMGKYYNPVSVTQQDKDITFVGEMVGPVYQTFNGNTYFDGEDINASTSKSLGQRAFFFDLLQPIDTSILHFKWQGQIYRNIISTQYGGNTYSARSNNEYQSCNVFRPIVTSSVDINDTIIVYGGDVVNDIIDEQRLRKNINVNQNLSTLATLFYPAQSIINPGLRYGDYINYSIFTTTYITDNYYYNKIYSAPNDIRTFFPKPDPYLTNKEYNTRFHISDIKINGELVDSWGIFKALNYYDVEGTYGPINAASYLQNEIYFAQDKAFGKLFVNPREAITSTDGDSIQIGSGIALDHHEYISTEIGTKHQWSFNKSGYYIYFFDIRHNKFYSFSQNRPLEPLSDMKGLHSWCINNIQGDVINNDRPLILKGIHCVFDYINNEIIYTILTTITSGEARVDKKYTIVYNELTQSWTSTNYPHYPKIYITNNKHIISADNNNIRNLYLHNYGNYGQFYGTYFDSFIEFFVNKFPTISKMFTNAEWNTEVIDSTGVNIEGETFNKIECTTDYQTTGIIPLINDSNLKRLFRTFRTNIPKSTTGSAFMSTGFYSNMKDKILKVKLSYINNGNKNFIVRFINTIFNINKPT